MNKNQFRIFFIFIAVIICSFFMTYEFFIPDKIFCGSLEEFKKGVEKEKKEKEEKKEEGSEDEEKDDDDSCCSSELFTDIAFFLFDINSEVRYSSFPYDEKNSEWLAFAEEQEGSRDLVGPGNGAQKWFFITLDLGGQYVDSHIASFFFNCHGRFCGVAGILIDYRFYKESTDSLHLQSYGIDLALLQLYWFDWNFYLQYARFSGLLLMDGPAFGSIFHLFPFRPFSIYFRIGELLLDDIAFLNLDIHAGLMIDRYELFIGYQILSAKYAELDGLKSGIRVWF